ncbi:hypothetical protein H2198_000149 [Neophaeococcomyces mojaviensis]|uniref:Uncharacterized protein n=1 Tax=Neophaeococcomyces mojaviensis TaxID=3383035 RepID=A0ACC3AKH6_9EURO|nr:hypothetical protein H2198_000149 [Knufia sp. JES_112]
MQHALFNHNKHSLPSPSISHDTQVCVRATWSAPEQQEEVVRRSKRVKLDESRSYLNNPSHALSTSNGQHIALHRHECWTVSTLSPARPFGVLQEYEVTQTLRTQSDWTTNSLSIPSFGPGILNTNVYFQHPTQSYHYPESRITSIDPSEQHLLEAGCSDVENSCSDTTSDIVCYGALRELDLVDSEVIPSCISGLRWDQSCLTNESGGKIPLSERTVQILTSLFTQGGVHFDFNLEQTASSQSKSKQRVGHHRSAALVLSAVLYGSRDAAEDIGDWLDSIELYLQTPTYSSLDVPYCNPHRTLDGTTISTGRLINLQRAPQFPQFEPCSTNSFDIFTTRMFEEAEQPSLIKSPLHNHQKQALTFMQGRECGWDFYNERGSCDLWQCQSDNFGREKFVDSLSGKSFFGPPDEFRGGLLADEMGLGKTCSMLSLIACSMNQLSQGNCDNHSSALTSNATLVVVPLPLLQVWEKQIREHFQTDSVHFLIYYGTTRKQCNSLTGFDIVLTTYNTVAKEWKSQKTKQTAEATPFLFQSVWHRIVLDEAHIIKNKDTDLAKAVSALNGERRWCITGTPIQNRSSDIYSLLRFLRVYPYNNFKTYEEAFVRPLKTGADIAALGTLQKLMRTLAIRRPRAVIDLPPREDARVEVEFTENEGRTYEEAKKGVMRIIEQAFTNGEGHAGFLYINALQRINELRYICNHGIAPVRKKQKTMKDIYEGNPGSIQRELDLLVAGDDSNTSTCINCGCDLFEEQGNDFLRVMQCKPQKLCSGLCNNCSLSTPSTPGSRDLDSGACTPPTIKHISSKVRALINEIQQTPRQDKCAVFSYWTSTLDLIGTALTEAGITHTRYDGSMSRTKRDAVLTSFASDNVKVILVSISCGGQGLDLTAANHAFLVEPQWNPMLEEQALSRVHRLGQKKPVRLVRFVVKKTWEEKIVSLQERKRMLAELIVDGPGEDAEKFKGEEGRRQLAMLRDLVA